MDTSVIVLIGMALFGWGVGSFLDKLAVGELGPRVVFITYLIASILTFSYFFLSGKISSVWTSKGMVYAILSGVFIAMSGIGYYTAIQKENVSLVTPFAALYPAITVILGVLILQEKIKLVNAAGIVLALVAGFLLAL